MIFRLCNFSILAFSLLPSILGTLQADEPAAPLSSPEAQLKMFHVPPGFEVQLVAAEPEIQKPLNLNFDSAGRLWVTGTTLYPWPARADALDRPIASFEHNWNSNGIAFRAAASPPPPSEHGFDTVRVLSDFDPATGHARKISVFADGLNIPIGIVPLPRRASAKGDTIIVHSIPSIWRLEDTDGDGRADVREELYTGFGFKDTHGMASNFTYWVDGWIYGTHGFANHSEVRDRSGRVTVLDSGNTYRFRPDGSHFEQWTHGQTNPFGLAFDPRGDIYTADSHSKPVYLLVHGGFYEGINKQHDGLGFAPPITLDDHGSSAIAGITYYAATQFPEEYRGNLFNGNPVTRRINRDRLDWTGSTPKAVRMPDFLTCDDPAFRPVQVKLGPDGALWIADFYNPIIGHYEQPLTHPNRDHAHGRIWRIVWRGEDNSVRAPVPPDFSTANASALVSKLADDNIVVRTLATNDLVERLAASSAVPALHAAAGKSAALPTAFALERLDATDDQKLFAPLATATTDSDAALTALRVLATRANLGDHREKFFTDLIARTTPGHLWRATADLFTTHSEAWQTKLLLTMMARTPAADTELTYALRLALKSRVAATPLPELNTLAAANPQDAERLADVALAAPTPLVAEFLMSHLERTKFTSPRAGEYARQAVMLLPPTRYDTIAPLIRSLAHAPTVQQLALAEGLAATSLLPGRVLPDDVTAWMRRTLVASFALTDYMLVKRAVEASQNLVFAEKNEPLRKLILNPMTSHLARLSAIRGVALDSEGIATLITLLNRHAEPIMFRRGAAERLAHPSAGPAGRAAILAVLPTAQNDLALTIASHLVLTEEGTAALIALVAQGKAPPALLRQHYVEIGLRDRSPALRAQVAELVKHLPTEDARLDAVINTRAAAFAATKANAEHGAAVFVQNCAVCHRFKNSGGNLGPSLDGIGSRSSQRVMEDILDPNRNVDPAFRLATISLKSGETRGGLNLRDHGDLLTLTDPATAQDFSVAKSTVSAVATSVTSPMPPAFESVISEKDFFDLLAYLLTPAKP